MEDMTGLGTGALIGVIIGAAGTIAGEIIKSKTTLRGVDLDAGAKLTNTLMELVENTLKHNGELGKIAELAQHKSFVFIRVLSNVSGEMRVLYSSLISFQERDADQALTEEERAEAVAQLIKCVETIQKIVEDERYYLATEISAGRNME